MAFSDDKTTGTENQSPVEPHPQASPTASLTERSPDAIYQKGQLVARVLNPQVDEQAREIRFGELYDSDSLLLPDECEFRKYVILVEKIADAAKRDPTAPHKGRVLRGVIAEILRYREN
jgi:hypothetical protein